MTFYLMVSPSQDEQDARDALEYAKLIIQAVETYNPDPLDILSLDKTILLAEAVLSMCDEHG